MPSLIRLSPSTIVITRRGAPWARAIAVAASGSVGETIAPRVKAAPQLIPSISAWATSATPAAVRITRPTASIEMARRFAFRSRSEEKKAAE